MTAPRKTLMLGPVSMVSGGNVLSRMSILIWGLAGVGKTTYAATAPGKKLWLSFGDSEHLPIVHRKDTIVADFSGVGIEELFKHAQSENPFGLDQVLSDHQDIETLVCDSLTAVVYKALHLSIKKRIGAGKGFIPTVEMPGISAYGGRNAIVLEVMQGLLRVTAKHKVHIVFTAHEDDPVMTDSSQGNIIDYVTVMLGGKIVGNTAWRLSEIWYMSQSELSGKERRIAIRPTRKRKPMKTRMFTDKGDPEFVVDYDADKPDKGQMTIASFYEDWVKNEGEKLPIPKARKR